MSAKLANTSAANWPLHGFDALNCFLEAKNRIRTSMQASGSGLRTLMEQGMLSLTSSFTPAPRSSFSNASSLVTHTLSSSCNGSTGRCSRTYSGGPVWVWKCFRILGLDTNPIPQHPRIYSTRLLYKIGALPSGIS